MQVFLQKQKIPEKSQKEICEDFGWQEKASLATLDKAHHVGQANHTERNASVGKLAFIMPMHSSESIIGTWEMQ